ncbi:DUF554 domain-containing protein [Mobilicoccus caccae]|uniref:Membrane protein n=1 Tax=Mobilicoccus caccae TaxID=1859295 RepID=A0ABQ6IND5_9MICO|nr:DUF554 domain-containing protein [Mobilicoccus caccae]GMA39447.1 membrane protein [Mobilicoccus caccae]
MDTPFPGLGTLVNTVAVVAGALLGMAAGHRLPEPTKRIVTDCLGLVTLLMAGLSVMAVTDPALSAAVGSSAPVLIVLGSLLLGGIIGSLLKVEARLESLVTVVRRRLARSPVAEHAPSDAALTVTVEPSGTPDRDGEPGHAGKDRFIEGWLTATLLFCVGPLTILGSINDGLGRGIDQLAVKSALDFFAAIAFASTFGLGVLFSAVSVLVIQGGLTLVGVLLGAVMPDAQIMALTATGGLMLVGIAFRLLDIRQIRVGDLLPALIVAPLLTAAVAALR